MGAKPEQSLRHVSGPGNLPGVAATSLDGTRLLVARIAWAATVLLTVVMFTASIPFRREQLLETIRTIRMGDPADFGNFMNAVIDEAAFTSIKAYIDHARSAADADILSSSRRRSSARASPPLRTQDSTALNSVASNQTPCSRHRSRTTPLCLP